MNSSGFAPVADPDARILILGTLPGAVSLETGQYYAQPRNAFWTIMGEVCGAGTSLPYEERLERLLRRRIAIWDVCASARRPGSLDSGIRASSIRPNNFRGFFASHPDLRLICFNGAKAAALFRGIVLPTLETRWAGVRHVTLPSSSPALASISLQRKIETWRAALTDGEIWRGM